MHNNHMFYGRAPALLSQSTLQHKRGSECSVLSMVRKPRISVKWKVPKKGGGGCFLSFIRFAVDMGNVCCDLPPQSEAVCHHIDSGNQKEKRPADYPLTGFQKIGCLQREARQFKKMLNGLSNRTECARATPTTPKKSQHSSLPSVLAQR